jgi:gas vesicle protein
MLGIGAALGAVLAYFFDPQNGKRRRHVTRDRTLAIVRRGGRRAGGYVAAEADGLMQKATHLREEPKDLDDVTLARKVETEIFRPADAPKGNVSVNVNDGVVELRGELSDQTQIDELGKSAQQVDGVKDVRNLLHTGTNGG